MFGSSKRHRIEKRTLRVARPILEGLDDRVLLSTFKVNTTLDTVAVDLKTGKDATGHISLRSAIQAANAKSNSDTIIVPAGTFTLTIPGANEDADATGDLDINGSVTIKGKNASSTIIDGNNLDRVFQVLSGKVQISGVTIQHGRSNEGGGLLNSTTIALWMKVVNPTFSPRALGWTTQAASDTYLGCGSVMSAATAYHTGYTVRVEALICEFGDGVLT